MISRVFARLMEAIAKPFGLETYGEYVVSCFLITFVALAIAIVQSRARQKRILADIKLRMQSMEDEQ